MIFFLSNFSRKEFAQWEEHPTFIQLIQTPPCQDFPWVFPLWNRVSRKPRYPGQFHLNLTQSYFVGQSLSHSILRQKQVLGNEFSGGGIFQSSSNGNFLLTGLERARWEWQSWVRYPGFPAAGTFSPSWDLSPSPPIPGRRQGERIPSHPARHHKATDGHRVKRSMRDRWDNTSLPSNDN